MFTRLTQMRAAEDKDFTVSGEVQKTLRHTTAENLASCTNRRQRAEDQEGSSLTLMSAAMENSTHRIR